MRCFGGRTREVRQMSKLTASGVTKVYGGKEALSQVSLELEQGKIYGLIGRNGAGKTTLLSVLTAQNPAASGEVLLDGQKVWENPKALSQLFPGTESDVRQHIQRPEGKGVSADSLRLSALLGPGDGGPAGEKIRAGCEKEDQQAVQGHDVHGDHYCGAGQQGSFYLSG